MRAFAALSLLLFLPGCTELADHGPASPRTLARMETQAVTKDIFLRRMQTAAPLPTASVTLPFKLVDGVPVAKARLNNHGPVPMMLDTGASRTMVQASLVVAAKVPVMYASDATVELQGIVGREQGRIGLLDPLRLGSWSLHGYPCLVRTYENRLTNRRGASRFPECLLGFDVALNRCTFLTLDYPSNEVIFGFQERFRPQAGKRLASTPFRLKQGVPVITLRSGAVRWEAIVDTGSFNKIEISESLAGRLGVQQQGEQVKGLYLMAVGGTVTSGQANLRTVKLPDLTLAGDRYQDVQVDIAPGPPRVGSFFLKDYRVTFDMRRKLLHLEW
jgi:predicted aspartyl protease